MVSLELVVEAVRRVLPPKRRDARLAPEVRFEDDLGMSSLEVSEVFVVLEELVGTPLDTTRIGETRTVGDLLLIRPAAEERAW